MTGQTNSDSVEDPEGRCMGRHDPSVQKKKGGRRERGSYASPSKKTSVARSRIGGVAKQLARYEINGSIRDEPKNIYKRQGARKDRQSSLFTRYFQNRKMPDLFALAFPFTQHTFSLYHKNSCRFFLRRSRSTRRTFRLFQRRPSTAGRDIRRRPARRGREQCIPPTLKNISLISYLSPGPR